MLAAPTPTLHSETMPTTRPAPITELRGRRIRLRPFRREEIDDAWRGLAGLDEGAHPRTRRQDRRPTPSEAFARRVERSGTLWRGCLDLAVDRRDRLVGQIQARGNPKQTLPPDVFEIGVVLYRPADRGKGYGAEAVSLLTTWLFDLAGAARVQAGTTADNRAMRSVLERLGFRLEGILRSIGANMDGTRVDGAMYAVLADEWRAEGGTR
jgi:RimJ/RimL family protein N-acetyltransferase